MSDSKPPSRRPSSPAGRHPKRRDPRVDSVPPPRVERAEIGVLRAASPRRSPLMDDQRHQLASLVAQLTELEATVAKQRDELTQEAALMGEMLVRVSSADTQKKKAEERANVADKRIAELERELEKARAEERNSAASVMQSADIQGMASEVRILELETRNANLRKKVASLGDELREAQGRAIVADKPGKEKDVIPKRGRESEAKRRDVKSLVEAEQRAQKAEARAAEAQAALTKARAAETACMAQLESDKAQFLVLEKELSHREEELKQAKARVQERESEGQALREAHAAIQDRTKVQDDHVKEVQAELDKVSSHASDLSKNVTELQDHNRSLAADLATLRGEQTSLREQCDSLQTELRAGLLRETALRNEVSDAQAARTSFEQQRDDLVKDLDVFKLERQVLEQRTDEHERSLGEAREALARKTSESEALEQELTRIKAEQAQLAEQLAHARIKNDELEDARAKAAASVVQSYRRVDESERICKELERQLSKVTENLDRNVLELRVERELMSKHLREEAVVEEDVQVANQVICDTVASIEDIEHQRVEQTHAQLARLTKVASRLNAMAGRLRETHPAQNGDDMEVSIEIEGEDDPLGDDVDTIAEEPRRST